jgi:hypothetical protein
MCFGMQATDQKTTSGTTASTGSNTSNIANNSTSGTTTGSNSLGASTNVNNNTSTGLSTGNTASNSLNTTSAQANPAVAKAAVGNLDFVNNLQQQGFQGYGGQQVAGIAPGQQQTIDAATGIAGNGTGATATNLIDHYAGAGPQSVQANTISSAMSPYMSQYVMQALAPQLHQMDISNAATDHATDAQATGSGAYGDARTGIQQANNSFNQNVQREGVIGNAYDQAFKTAIAAGGQDVSNNLNAQNANAGYQETALSRALGGSNALEGLQTQQLGAQGTANTLASQNTQNNQAQLTAQYNQWLLAQQYPFQTAALANSTIGTAASAMPASTTNTGSNVGTNASTTANNSIGSSAGTTTGSTAGTSNTNTAGSVVGTGTNQATGTNSGTSTETKPDNSGLGFLGGLFSAPAGSGGASLLSGAGSLLAAI